MPPIRIAADLSVLAVNPLTGVGVHTLNLFRAFLALDGFDVRLFANSRSLRTEYLDRLAPQCSRARFLRASTTAQNLLWTTLAWPPIEYFSGPADIAYGGFHLLPAARRAIRTAMIFDVSWRRCPGIKPPRNEARHERLVRHAAAHAGALFVMAASTRDDLAELYGVDPARVHVVPGGIDPAEFDAPGDPDRLAAIKQQFGIRDPYFLYTGNLEPRKNLERLLEAYARVRAARRGCPQLVLVGQPAWLYRPIFETIERLKLNDAVVSTGYLPNRADVIGLMRGALGFVYVSLYEGFGLPVLEAMTAGAPVLTSNTSSLPEVIGDTGRTVDPASIDAIEDGILELLDHPAAAQARAQTARNRARRFTWTHSAESFAHALRAIAQQ